MRYEEKLCDGELLSLFKEQELKEKVKAFLTLQGFSMLLFLFGVLLLMKGNKFVFISYNPLGKVVVRNFVQEKLMEDL